MGRKLIDLTGQRFGRLTVLERAENDNQGGAQWLCQCDCGIKCVVRSGNLKSGKTKSCGCLHKEGTHTTHGLAHDKIYGVWNGIRKRCFNPRSKAYKNYGARGIKMYEPWINDVKAFYDYVSQLEHFGEEGYSLDRIDNDGNYEPGNLRWATETEQQRNRRNNIIVEYEGQKMTLTEASEKSKVNFHTLRGRYYHGERGDFLFRLP